MKNFFKNILYGAAIGVAMIIPGVSGGTIAVLLDIYDKLIDALGSLRKNFKENILFLIPILLGAVLAFAAMYFPLYYALIYAPLPTVLLFVGLMIGSLPKLFSESRTYGFDKLNVVSVIVPFILIIGICVSKLYISAGSADLSAAMPLWGYFALFAVAMLASCALVVPGVSGSMLLMIFGYYDSIFETIKLLLSDFWHSALVLVIFAFGLVLGFFSIAKLMKYFLKRFPRGTHWAIVGFVLGSIPAVFIVFDYASAPLDGLQIGLGCALCVLGAVLTYALTAYMSKKIKDREE